MLLSAKHGLEIAAPPPNPNGATVSDNIATGELPIQAQYSLRKTARGGGGSSACMQVLLSLHGTCHAAEPR